MSPNLLLCNLCYYYFLFHFSKYNRNVFVIANKFSISPVRDFRAMYTSVVLFVLYCIISVRSELTTLSTDFETFLQVELKTVELLENFSVSESQRIVKLQK